MKGKNRLIIGVTGNIGAGKTTVSRLFEKWGATVLEGDKVGHEALALKKDEVLKAFGNGILDEQGRIDRKKLGRVVFGSDEALERYHAIIREPVRQIMRRRIEGFARGILVFDAALLFELGLEGLVDIVVLVRSPREKLLSRSVRSKGYDEKILERILANQWPEKRKAQLSDEVIDNDGTLDELEAKCRALWEKLTGRKVATG